MRCSATPIGCRYANARLICLNVRLHRIFVCVCARRPTACSAAAAPSHVSARRCRRRRHRRHRRPYRCPPPVAPPCLRNVRANRRLAENLDVDITDEVKLGGSSALAASALASACPALPRRPSQSVQRPVPCLPDPCTSRALHSHPVRGLIRTGTQLSKQVYSRTADHLPPPRPWLPAH